MSPAAYTVLTAVCSTVGAGIVNYWFYRLYRRDKLVSRIAKLERQFAAHTGITNGENYRTGEQ